MVFHKSYFVSFPPPYLLGDLMSNTFNSYYLFIHFIHKKSEIIQSESELSKVICIYISSTTLDTARFYQRVQCSVGRSGDAIHTNVYEMSNEIFYLFFLLSHKQCYSIKCLNLCYKFIRIPCVSYAQLSFPIHLGTSFI
jgi:hypothetical protein